MQDVSADVEDGTSSAAVPPAAVEMVLWTRQPVCGSRTAVVDRLSELEAAGAIGDFAVRTWSDEVVLSEHTGDDGVMDHYDRFREWAAATDADLSPAFERRTVSPLIGESREVLTLPMLCLAVSVESELAVVVPCSAKGRQWDVVGYLDGYAAGRWGPRAEAGSIAPFLD